MATDRQKAIEQVIESPRDLTRRELRLLNREWWREYFHEHPAKGADSDGTGTPDHGNR